jgi:hypothetical protein
MVTPDLKVVSLKEKSVILTAASPYEWISCDSTRILSSRPACGTMTPKSPDVFDIGFRYDQKTLQTCLSPQQCFELRITQTGRNQFTYAMRPVVTMPYETETELQRIFFRKDLSQLQKLLQDGMVTLDSVTSRGEPLLLVLALGGNVNGELPSDSLV